MYNFWSDKEVALLKKLYPSKGARVISKIINRSLISIRTKATKLNIKNIIRNKQNTYRCDDTFFSKPNLINSYWAGFIAADGCVNDLSNRKNILQIAVHPKDVSLITRFKKDIKYTGNVKFYRNKTTNLVQIRITSDKICEDLKKNFNITPRKSLTLRPPKGLTKQQARAYLVGYIDGDGCISIDKKNKVRLDILGTNKNLMWFCKILNINTKYIYKRKSENVYRLVLTCNLATKVIKYLKQTKIPKLGRKWDKI